MSNAIAPVTPFDGFFTYTIRQAYMAVEDWGLRGRHLGFATVIERGTYEDFAAWCKRQEWSDDDMVETLQHLNRFGGRISYNDGEITITQHFL